MRIIRRGAIMAVWKKTKDHEARYFTQNDFEMRKVTEEYWCRYGIVRKDRNHVTMPHGYLVIIRKYREFKQVYENGIFVTINGRVVRTHIANGDLYLQVFSSITKRKTA